MLEIRYSLDEAGDILGTQKDVELFRQKVLEFLETDSEKMQIDIQKNIDAEPWNFVALGLEILQNDEPVKVSISDEKIIRIEGSKKKLEDFTSFLYFDEDSRKGSHSHFEYYNYEGNVYVHPDSFPLIIGIK